MIAKNCSTAREPTAPLRILIIGGTRFIGPPLVRSLMDSGHEVTLSHRGTTSADLPSGVTHVHGDRKELLKYRDVVRNLAPDVVIAMVGYTRPMPKPSLPFSEALSATSS